MLNGPPLSCAPSAGLHLVGNEQDPILVADAAEFLQEDGWGDDIAAFSLDRFDEDCGYFLRSQCCLEEFLFDVTRTAEREFFFILLTAATTAVGIGITHMRDSGDER